jgi:hypothetical protein
MLSTLVHWVKAVCDTSSLPQELKFLHETFKNNCYGKWQILHTPNPLTRALTLSTEDHTLVAFLSFVGTSFNRISRVVSKRNIKTLGLPPRKLSSFVWPFKDDLVLKAPGICSIPCDCGNMYIGQRECSIEASVKEHHRHLPSWEVFCSWTGH